MEINMRAKSVALGVIIIAAIFSIKITIIYTVTGRYGPLDFSIVIDSGSNYSEAVLFKWPGNKYRNNGLIKEMAKCTINSGLDQYEYNYEMQDNFKKCLLSLKIKCLEEDKKITKPIPVYIAAGEKLRLLNITKPDNVTRILNTVKTVIEELNFDVRKANVISGAEEGLFKWISVNYLLKNLPYLGKLSLQSVTDTSGILDMGSVSSQIAFFVEDFDDDDNNDNNNDDNNNNQSNNNKQLHTKTQLYGRSYKIYTQSDQCSGVDEFYKKYRLYLIEESKNKHIIDDPCLYQDMKLIVRANELLSPSCLNIIITENKTASNIVPTEIYYTFRGMSDYFTCLSIIENLIINDFKTYSYKYNLEIPKEVPNIDMKFIALSNYFYVARALKKLTSADSDSDNFSFTKIEFRQKTQEWCIQSLETLAKRHFIDQYVHKYCFMANYIYVTLTKIYGFDDKLFSNINFTNTIDNIPISLAYGYMIEATYILEALPLTQPWIPLSIYVILIVMLSAAIFISIAVILCKNRGTSYISDNNKS